VTAADERDGLGRPIVRTSWAGTAIFVVAALAATVAPDALATGFAVLSVGLFLLGIAFFLWAYAIAVSRSRTDAIGIGGLFFLQRSAPRSVQVRLLLPFAIEVVVAFVAASIRIYTPLAFGLLVPMFGLGLAGLWGARYGRFDPRRTAEGPAEA
jgi:hypothetical protein